jgi:hypothetical protein
MDNFLVVPLLHSVSDFDRRFHYNVAASHFLNIVRLGHAGFLQLLTRFLVAKQFVLPALRRRAHCALSTPRHHTSCCLSRHLRILPGVPSRLFSYCVPVTEGQVQLWLSTNLHWDNSETPVNGEAPSIPHGCWCFATCLWCTWRWE